MWLLIQWIGHVYPKPGAKKELKTTVANFWQEIVFLWYGTDYKGCSGHVPYVCMDCSHHMLLVIIEEASPQLQINSHYIKSICLSCRPGTERSMLVAYIHDDHFLPGQALHGKSEETVAPGSDSRKSIKLITGLDCTCLHRSCCKPQP